MGEKRIYRVYRREGAVERAPMDHIHLPPCAENAPLPEKAYGYHWVCSGAVAESSLKQRRLSGPPAKSLERFGFSSFKNCVNVDLKHYSVCIIHVVNHLSAFSLIVCLLFLQNYKAWHLSKNSETTGMGI